VPLEELFEIVGTTEASYANLKLWTPGFTVPLEERELFDIAGPTEASCKLWD
jgi:hypothetical protein